MQRVARVAVQRVLVFILMLAASAAQAYSGPGSGISFVGALISVLVSVVLVIGAILAWPFRAWLKHRRKRAADSAESAK
jgi:Kef-type K+ transport system membrane component KefB